MSRRKWITKLFTPVNIIICLLIVVAFFYRAYLHLFVVTHWMPCDEVMNYITIRSLVQTGQPVDISFYPHGMHFFIYGIWWLIRINPETLCMFFNPVIGALSVIVFFYLTKHFVNKRNALLSSFIFVFSEAHLYRSAHFGSSEALGILLMLGAFYFFVKKRYVLCGLCMVLIYEVHLLPFFFGFAVLGINVFVGHLSKKTFVALGVITGVVIGLFYTSLFPYQRQLGYVIPTSFISRINIEKFMLFPLSELIMYGLTFLGSIIVMLISLKSFKKSDKFIKIWIVVAVCMVLFLQLTYSSLTIGSYRMIVYISIGFILLYSFANFVGKNFFTVIIIIVMILGPFCFGGNSLMFRINDSLMTGEIQAIEWTSENLNLTKSFSYLFADYSVIEYCKLYLVPEIVIKSEFSYTRFKDNANNRINFLENKSASSVDFSLVFLSERMEKRAFFERWIITEAYIRTFKCHKSIVDIWFNNPEWENIYNKNGVKIYRRIDNVVT